MPVSLNSIVRPFADPRHISRSVKIWLIIGLVMIFIQIVIGGVTRLTGSGLSITRWEIVTGAVPPLSEPAWQEAFDLYKSTPQYQKINEGMSMADFKYIFFWEYFHRLWARLMFVVFIIPFGWFLITGKFSRQLLPRLLIVVLLAGLEGFFGWIMVASGLIQRPWVNAYNLTLHLCMALVIYSHLMWTTFMAFQPSRQVIHREEWRKFTWGIFLLAFFQIALGAMMSGTKAGLFYPTWPDMRGAFLPSVLLDGGQWAMHRFVEYDTHPFMPTLLQFLHRNTAYILTIIILYFLWKTRNTPLPRPVRSANYLVLSTLAVQILLGILTLINCISRVPVLLGVLHQAGAVLLLSSILYLVYQWNGGLKSTNVDKVS